ncbi:signal peptidase I [Gracilibacillus sp. YIM 98692]|uniref:signal peptidase I n=1 Tax=Gracilibacillus sp. YIM 98692 TaxID=2663532 RepID=UPI0013D25CD5|nr:signal peptidase I [Gracilibacillus sp. YIM 98692]
MTKKKNDWADWIKTIIITALIIILLRMFIAVPIVVEGPSMYPTLADNERLIVDKLSLTFSDIKRFDIVVFHATAQRDYIKRVIGLPGDQIEYIDDQLYVNGQVVKESFLDQAKQTLGSNETYTTNFDLSHIPGNQQEVPDGHVFVLGDNRPNSTDSRHLGFIPMDQIVGVARFTYWPIGEIGFVD